MGLIGLMDFMGLTGLTGLIGLMGLMDHAKLMGTPSELSDILVSRDSLLIRTMGTRSGDPPFSVSSDVCVPRGNHVPCVHRRTRPVVLHCTPILRLRGMQCWIWCHPLSGVVDEVCCVVGYPSRFILELASLGKQLVPVPSSFSHRMRTAPPVK